MRMRLPSLLGALVLSGCASHKTVPDSSQAYVSPVAVQAARSGVKEADVSVSTAAADRDTAARFVEITATQAEAAQSRLRAQPNDRTESARFAAAQAKHEYALRLLAQREAELKIKRDQLSVAQAQLEIAKFNSSPRRTYPSTLRGLEDSLDRANRKLVHDQQIVATRMGETERARFTWEQRRSAADYAAAGSARQSTQPPLDSSPSR
jgi:hypothetical protein